MVGCSPFADFRSEASSLGDTEQLAEDLLCFRCAASDEDCRGGASILQTLAEGEDFTGLFLTGVGHGALRMALSREVVMT